MGWAGQPLGIGRRVPVLLPEFFAGHRAWSPFLEATSVGERVQTSYRIFLLVTGDCSEDSPQNSSGLSSTSTSLTAPLTASTRTRPR
jgi:hypothetical protein